MKLFDYYRSSSAYRVRIALHLKGLDYEKVPVNLLTGAQTSNSYKAINPQGRVPTLVDGELLLIQSPAILEYLDEAYPETLTLLDGDPVRRAYIRSLVNIIACDIHPISNLSVLNYLKENLGADQDTVNAWYSHWIQLGFQAIEDIIADSDGPFLCGQQPTLADVYLVPQVYNSQRVSLDLSTFPRIVAANKAANELEAFRKAHPDA